MVLEKGVCAETTTRIRFQERAPMKAMLLGFAAAIVIAVGASVALTSIDHSSASRFSSSSVRL
ncbi:hypothetical protein D3093_22785 (plasmid) [Azospirillum argentinense]|uniref:Uncharacterized protein n=3 Tax=Azospirillum TaxID=191 RepID=A0A4D8PQV5_9PROT|nr:hypothetical protein D3093_22785 [Azospirillum argentinense]